MSNQSELPKFIFVTGPEASGKSRLTEALGKKWNAPWVPEYAREYLSALDRPYQEEDILRIGQQQWKLQQNMQQLTRAPFLFCDTGFLVLKIWMEFRYGKVHPWIEEQFVKTPAHVYLLCRPDIPWEPDPLREHPQQRAELFALYVESLEAYQKPYRIIEGTDFKERLDLALRSI